MVTSHNFTEAARPNPIRARFVLLRETVTFWWNLTGQGASRKKRSHLLDFRGRAIISGGWAKDPILG
jgi:hypothetical protein